MFNFIKSKFNTIKQMSKSELGKDETEFLPAVLEITETPPSPIGRMMIWTIVILITCALIWAIIGQVDEVAVAPGKMIPTGYVKVIQPEDKGVVKNIFVRDGQQVKQGELMVELDTTFSQADVARIRKEFAYYSLEIERLTAERENQPFTPKLQPGMDEKDIELQQRLYQSRQEAHASKMATAIANVNQNIAAVAVARATQAKYAALYEIALEKEQKIEQLVEEHAVARFVLLDHRSKRLELEQSLAAQNAEIQRAGYALAQSQESRQNIVAEREKEIATRIVESRKQLLSYTEDLKKAEEKNRLSRITAPIDGRVHQLAIHTIGGIVTAAQPLMMVVPEDGTIEVEAWVANKDIGFLKVGQKAAVKIETFSFQKYGTIDGEVAELSPDAVEDKDKGRVYRAIVKLNKDYVFLNDRPVYLSPGMSVTAEIKIRQKRIIEFFLDPFRTYQSEGLRER
jgi:hemolysin D